MLSSLSRYKISLVSSRGGGLPGLALAGLALTGLLAGCLAVSKSSIAPRPWPQEQAVGLQPDSRVVWGRLDNGFRYVILPNAKPEERLSLRLQVASGSLNETEEQRGLAHFLEHMAFNGSKHFQDSTALTSYFQRLGMGYGTDTNAYTSFDETVYMLELPKNTPEMLDSALTMFRDYADGLLLKTEDIDKERGVVLSEMRDRESADYRIQIATMKFLLDGTRVPDRSPIGTPQVLKGCPPEEIRRYYHNYYCAERMVLVAVGQVQPEELAPLVKRYFGDLHTGGQPDKPMGAPKTGQGLHAAVCTEKEATETSVTLAITRAPELDADSPAKRILEYRRMIAGSMLNRRIEDLCRKPDAKIAQGGVMTMQMFDSAYVNAAQATCKQDRWQDGVAVMEQEIRRACEHGFAAAELDVVKAALVNAAEEGVRTAATRQSAGLAAQLCKSIGQKEVFITPEAELELVRKACDGFGPAEAQAVFRQMWESPDLGVMVTGRAVVAGGADEVLKALEASRKTSVAAAAEKVVTPFAYTGPFSDSPVVAGKSSSIDDLGFCKYDFGDVKLNVKKTDFEKGRILVTFRFGSGAAGMPRDKQGLVMLANATFLSGGLEAHDAAALRDLLAGKTVSTGFSVADDAFVLSGATNAADLKLQLQVLCAYLAHPGFRDDGLLEFRANLDTLYREANSNPIPFLKDKIFSFLRGNDPRWGLPPQATLAGYTMADVAAWLKPELASGPLEITVVGDVDEAMVLKDVMATAGTLPKRQPQAAIPASAWHLAAPVDVAAKEFAYDSQDPRGIVMICWWIPKAYDMTTARRLEVFKEAVQDRLLLKIREEAGAAYSPMAKLSYREEFENGHFLAAIVQVDPKRADEVIELSRKVMADLLKSGISQDDFDRMVRPLRNEVRDSRRTNGYWLSVLGDCNRRPEWLEQCRTEVQAFETMTPAEVNETARKVFDPLTTTVVRLMPKPAAAK